MAWSFLSKHTLDVVGKPCLRGKFQELWWVSPIRADGHWFNRAVARTHAGGHCSVGCNTMASCQADSRSELICFHQQSWLSNLETEYFRGRVIMWLNVREPNNCKRDTYWRVECFLSLSQQLLKLFAYTPMEFLFTANWFCLEFLYFSSALAKCESVHVLLRASLQISETWSPSLCAHYPLK